MGLVNSHANDIFFANSAAVLARILHKDSPGEHIKIWYFQEPITRSVQLTYFRVTAFSQVKLFLDTPFPRISFQKPIRSGA